MKQITLPSDTPHAEAQRALDGRATRWDEHRSTRRDELVLAARRAIHRGGPGVAMGDIAAEAATSKSVYYRYFGDKEGLRRAIGDDVISRLRDAIVAAGNEASHPEAALTAMIGTYLAQAEASPNTYAFVMGPSEAGPQDAMRHVSDQLTELFKQRLQQLSTDPVDALALALWPAAALGFIRMAGESWLTQPRASRPSSAQLTQSLTAWLLSGPLGPVADSSSSPS